MRTIVITGGHHNSALVVARELVSRGSKVIWVGHRHSSRGDRVDSAEYLEVTASGIPFYDLVAGKLTSNPSHLVQLPLGVIRSLSILRAVAPDAILSFGGYLGGTVAFAGKVLNIPIYLHEQTVTAGRANMFIARLAKKVYLTWPESKKYFRVKNTMVVGLPLRSGILAAVPASLFTRRKPTLLIMGGKQGAHVINRFVFSNLDVLLTHYNLVHQTGTSSLTRDYEYALLCKKNLGSLVDSYLPFGYINEYEIGTYLRSADMYLGRSGAHICYELAILALQSVLVPLMSTHDHEQHKNAKILEHSGIGQIISESDLNITNFLSKKFPSVRPLPLPLDAGIILVDDLLRELK